MKVLRKGNLKRVEKRKEKERKKLEKEKRKAREAAETVTFHCKNCGCKYSAKRNEYYIISPTYFLETGRYEAKLTTLVGLDCPCCGELVEAVLPHRLSDITSEDIKRYRRHRRKVIEETY